MNGYVKPRRSFSKIYFPNMALLEWEIAIISRRWTNFIRLNKIFTIVFIYTSRIWKLENTVFGIIELRNRSLFSFLLFWIPISFWLEASSHCSAWRTEWQIFRCHFNNLMVSKNFKQLFTLLLEGVPSANYDFIRVCLLVTDAQVHSWTCRWVNPAWYRQLV